MLILERGELLGFRADELVVGRRARPALGEFFGDPFGDPVWATSPSGRLSIDRGKTHPVSLHVSTSDCKASPLTCHDRIL